MAQICSVARTASRCRSLKTWNLREIGVVILGEFNETGGPAGQAHRRCACPVAGRLPSFLSAWSCRWRSALRQVPDSMYTELGCSRPFSSW